MSCVVQVYFESDNDARRNPPKFEIIETPFADFAEFGQHVEADALIGGDRLWTMHTDDRGVKEVTRRTPVLFRGSTVARACLPTWRFVEGEES